MIFGKSKEQLKDLKAIYTASEIQQQPKLWQKTYEIVKSNKEKIKEFLNKNVSKDTK